MRRKKKLRRRLRHSVTCQTQPWDLSQERQFMENLVGNRFNWLMVLFGVILVYAFSVQGLDERCTILCCGTIVVFAMAYTVHRAQVKLDYILRLLHRTNGHPVRRIGHFTKRYPKGSGMSTWLVGTIIPFGCAAILLILTSATIYERNGQVPYYLWIILGLGLLLVLGSIGNNLPDPDNLDPPNLFGGVDSE